MVQDVARLHLTNRFSGLFIASDSHPDRLHAFGASVVSPCLRIPLHTPDASLSKPKGLLT